MTAKQLREERAKLAATIKQMADTISAENREFTAEEEAAWAKVNADYDSLTRRIQAAERAEVVEGAQHAPARADDRIGREDHDGQAAAATATGITDEHRALALQSWFRAQVGEDLSEAHLVACQLLGFNPRRSNLDLAMLSTHDARRLQAQYRQHHPSRAVQQCMDFRATMGTMPGASGGYLIPPATLIRQLEINMLAFGGVRQVADFLRTASGERISWPTGDDTSNTGAQLGESVSIGSSVDPSFAQVHWDAYKFSSKPILVPFELLQDSAFDLVSVLGDMLGERLGRITNTKFTTGTGAATPKGIVQAATTFSATSATAIAFDDILGLEHAVDPAYRTGNAGFMCHDSILLAIRKLKDGVGRYLWESNVQVGQPDRIHGYPVILNQDMDSTMSSGKKTLLFGQLSKYKIRTVAATRMYRLQERYRDNDQDCFIAFLREDGNLLTAGTAPIKVLAHS